MSWLLNNISTIIICIVLIAVIVAIISYIVKNIRQGKTSCGCGCKSCAMKDSCHSGRWEECIILNLSQLFFIGICSFYTPSSIFIRKGVGLLHLAIAPLCQIQYILLTDFLVSYIFRLSWVSFCNSLYFICYILRKLIIFKPPAPVFTYGGGNIYSCFVVKTKPILHWNNT